MGLERGARPGRAAHGRVLLCDGVGGRVAARVWERVLNALMFIFSGLGLMDTWVYAIGANYGYSKSMKEVRICGSSARVADCVRMTFFVGRSQCSVVGTPILNCRTDG
jgi:hypothetical protein